MKLLYVFYWSGSSKGMVMFVNKQFQFEIEVPPEMEAILFNWVEEIANYRLHRYFERESSEK